MIADFDPAALHLIQRKLLSWFSTHKRNLPWRKKRNPYATFVSEFMLQQTQIQTVIPYFNRWMKIFPSVRQLAKAPLDRILKQWEGLGYYTRARNLHQSAKLIVKKHGGKIPSHVDELLALPGIGRYTAGAIASIGHGIPAPIVDGNVSRVLTRLLCLRDDIVKQETQKKLYGIAASLVPRQSPGEFNQAMMELGSLVCFPDLPNCPVCPIRRICRAYQKGVQASLPVKSKAAKPRALHLAAGIIHQNGKWLVRKRPPKGIWGGLWELPNAIPAGEENFEDALKRELDERHHIKIRSFLKKPPLVHHLTHLTMTFHPMTAEAMNINKRPAKLAGSRWLTLPGLTRLSFPVAHQKMLRLI